MSLHLEKFKTILGPEKSRFLRFLVLLLILKIEEEIWTEILFLFARGMHQLLKYAVAFGQTYVLIFLADHLSMQHPSKNSAFLKGVQSMVG